MLESLLNGIQLRSETQLLTVKALISLERTSWDVPIDVWNTLIDDSCPHGCLEHSPNPYTSSHSYVGTAVMEYRTQTICLMVLHDDH